jgi:hypothetical protein
VKKILNFSLKLLSIILILFCPEKGKRERSFHTRTVSNRLCIFLFNVIIFKTDILVSLNPGNTAHTSLRVRQIYVTSGERTNELAWPVFRRHQVRTSVPILWSALFPYVQPVSCLQIPQQATAIFFQTHPDSSFVISIKHSTLNSLPSWFSILTSH